MPDLRVFALGLLILAAGPRWGWSQEAVPPFEPPTSAETPPPSDETPLQTPPPISGDAGAPRIEAEPLPAPADEPGYLGLLTDDRGEQGQGVRVVEVVAGSPASEAGLQAGDQIIGINQQTVGTLADYESIVKRSLPGDQLVFSLLRNEEPIDIPVTLTKRPPPDERPFQEFGRIAQPQPATAALTPSGPRPLLGVRTEPLTDATRRALGIPTGNGALVRQVIPDSPAAKAGIPPDALILGVNGRGVANPDDLTREVAAAGAGARATIAFLYAGQTHTREVVLGGDAGGANRTWRSPEASPVATTPPTAVEGDRIERLERRIAELESLVERLARQQEEVLRRIGLGSG